MLKKQVLAFIIILICINIKAQQTTQFKLNLLPIVLNGYGASIEQRIYKQFTACF